MEKITLIIPDKTYIIKNKLNAKNSKIGDMVRFMKAKIKYKHILEFISKY